MRQPPIQYVRTKDGVSLAYTVRGAGRPLILVPSRMSHQLHNWSLLQAWLQPLAERCRLIQYDARGQGLSSRNLDLGLSTHHFVQDLLTVMDELRIESAVLFSHGYGAHIAARAAAQCPERVQALILAGASVDMSEWTMTFWKDVARDNWEYFLRHLTSRDLSKADADAHVARLKECETYEDFVLVSSIVVKSQIRRVLPRIKVPTLVMHPRNFKMLAPDAGAKLAAGLAASRLAVLDGDENAFLGDPDEFVSAIDDFLGGLAKSRESGAGEHAAPHSAGEQRSLSRRQQQVLLLLAAGKSNREIANEFVLSERTIERHVADIYARINVRNRAEATSYALGKMPPLQV